MPSLLHLFSVVPPPRLQAACQLGILGAGVQVAGPSVAGDAPSGPNRDPEVALREFLRSIVLTQGRQQIPYASEAHRLVTELQEDPSGSSYAAADCATALHELNRSLDTLLASVSPSHRASVAAGAGIVRVDESWTQSRASLGHGHRTSRPLLREVTTATRVTGLHGAVAHGMLGAILGLPRDAVLDAYAYSTARGAVNAATRLNLVGPQRAVAIQTELAEVAIEIADSSQFLRLDKAAGVSPILDTVHCAHDVLELRLFRT